MHSVCCCSLAVWRRSFLKKGTPVTYFGPTLDPPLGGSGRKTTTLVRDLEYFIYTKFHQNLSSGSGEKVKNVNCLTDDRRTDDGQSVITIGHWSLWLLCPKYWNLYMFLQRNALIDIKITIIDICYTKTGPIPKTLMFSLLHEWKIQ